MHLKYVLPEPKRLSRFVSRAAIYAPPEKERTETERREDREEEKETRNRASGRQRTPLIVWCRKYR